MPDLHLILAVVTSVGPCIAVMLYFVRRSSPRPDRTDVVMRVFRGGVAVTVPALLAQMSLTYLTAQWALPAYQRCAYEAFLGTALVEESLKLWIVLSLAYRRPEFREVKDGIVYAITAGLGFCCLENILYAGAEITIALSRACTALPLHALASGLMGYELGLAKLRPRSRRRVWHGLWKAVLVHGTYNFILMLVTTEALPTATAFLIVPLLGIAFSWLVSELRLAHRKDRAQAVVFGRDSVGDRT